MLKLRIFTVDHYLVKPESDLDACYSIFRGKEVKQVPVLRIFGSTDEGTKCCLHVHGVFPYFYVPFNGDSNSIDAYCHQLAISLDKALNIALGQADSPQQHVYQALPVAAFPLYGFHDKKLQYIKLYLFNPRLIRKAAQLVQNAAILNTVLQPYEAHINFELQFMIDYNLHGMNFIELSQVTFRSDVLNVNETEMNENNLKKMSTCKLECDCSYDQIVNVKSVNSSSKNPGIAEIWAEEAERRRNQGKPADLATEISQTREEQIVNNYYLEKLAERLTNMEEHSNLSSTLDKSIYPSEVSDSEKFSNVSLRLPVDSICVSKSNSPTEDLNATLVDANAILRITQQNDSSLHDLYNVLVALENENSNLPDKNSALSQFVQMNDDDCTDILENVDLDDNTINFRIDNVEIETSFTNISQTSKTIAKVLPIESSEDSVFCYKTSPSSESNIGSPQVTKPTTLFTSSDELFSLSGSPKLLNDAKSYTSNVNVDIQSSNDEKGEENSIKTIDDLKNNAENYCNESLTFSDFGDSDSEGFDGEKTLMQVDGFGNIDDSLILTKKDTEIFRKLNDKILEKENKTNDLNNNSPKQIKPKPRLTNILKNLKIHHKNFQFPTEKKRACFLKCLIKNKCHLSLGEKGNCFVKLEKIKDIKEFLNKRKTRKKNNLDLIKKQYCPTECKVVLHRIDEKNLHKKIEEKSNNKREEPTYLDAFYNYDLKSAMKLLTITKLPPYSFRKIILNKPITCTENKPKKLAPLRNRKPVKSFFEEIGLKRSCSSQSISEFKSDNDKFLETCMELDLRQKYSLLNVGLGNINLFQQRMEDVASKGEKKVIYANNVALNNNDNTLRQIQNVFVLIERDLKLK